MKCPKCGSEEVIMHAVTVQKKQGCLAVCGWILLAVCTVGIGLLLIPLLIKKGDKINTVAICLSCGKRWTVKR